MRQIETATDRYDSNYLALEWRWSVSGEHIKFATWLTSTEDVSSRSSAKVQTDRIRLHTHAIQAIQPILQLTYSDLPDFCSRTQSLQSPAIQARDSYDWDDW